MKKIFLTMVALVLMGTTAMAQRSYFDVNFGYSQDNTYDSDLDFQIKNLSVGYNMLIAEDLYFGGTLGYSILNADKSNYEVNLFTLTPRLTYQMQLGSNFYWTPNLYVTLGYGSKDLDLGVGKYNHYNVRAGLNILSFDYRINNVFAVNLNVLTPYYNYMKVSYSENDNLDYNYNGLVYLGASIGLKISL